MTSRIRRTPSIAGVLENQTDTDSESCTTRIHNADHLVERELKYFVPIATLKKHVTLPELRKELISQSYFPRELTAVMGVFAAELSGQMKYLSGFTYSQARLRQVSRPDGRVRWYLQAKGRMHHLDHFERVEVSAPISENLYVDLLPTAQDGTLEKNRYHVAGSGIAQSGESIGLTCEIDVIVKAGDSSTDSEPISTNFATVDLELPSKDLVEQVRAGKHSFHFLLHGCELSTSLSEQKKLLSARRLARKGLDKKAFKAIDSLLALAPKSSKRASVLRG